MAIKSYYSTDAGTGLNGNPVRPANLVSFRPRLTLSIEYGAKVPARYADLDRSEVDYAGMYPVGHCDNCGGCPSDHVWQVYNPADRYYVVDCNRDPRRA